MIEIYTVCLAPASLTEWSWFFLLCFQEYKRKVSLFSNTSQGARVSAIIYSIVETAMAKGATINRRRCGPTHSERQSWSTCGIRLRTRIVEKTFNGCAERPKIGGFKN